MNVCNISWDRFGLHSEQTFSRLYESQLYADVTLVPDDGLPIPAHRFVLSSSSTVIEQMFTKIGHFPGNQVIYLPTVHHEELVYLLQFIYLGETRVEQEKVDRFFQLAAEFKIDTSSKIGGATQNRSDSLKDENNDNVTRSKIFEELSSVSPSDKSYEWVVKEDTHTNVNVESEVNEYFEYNDHEFEEDTELHRDEYGEEDALHNQQNDDDKSTDSQEKEKDEKDNLVKEKAKKVEILDTSSGHFLKIFRERLKFEYPAEMNSKSTVCPECKKKFSSTPGLQLHYRSIHKKIKYPCDQCDHKATQWGALATHKRVVHENIKVQCPKCPNQLQSKTALKYHMEKAHNKKYPCTLCDYEGINAGALKQHLESFHGGRKFPCSRCSYQASTPGHLDFHMNLHCDSCKKVSFSLKESIKHKKTHE